MMRDDNDETGVSLQPPCPASQQTDAPSTPIFIHSLMMPMPGAGTQAASSTNQATDAPIDRPPAHATLYSFSSPMTELQLPLRIHPRDVDNFVLFDAMGTESAAKKTGDAVHDRQLFDLAFEGTAIDSDSATLSFSPRAKTPDDQQMYPAVHLVCFVDQRNQAAFTVCWRLRSCPRFLQGSRDYVFYFKKPARFRMPGVVEFYDSSDMVNANPLY